MLITRFGVPVPPLRWITFFNIKNNIKKKKIKIRLIIQLKLNYIKKYKNNNR